MRGGIRATALDERRLEIRRKAQRIAGNYYLRWGRVPAVLTEIIAATASEAALWKYSPDQPRVPAGSSDGGQWTSGDGGDGIDPVDAISPVYFLESLILSFLPVGPLRSLWQAFTALSEAGTGDASWTLGAFKSAEKWASQISKGSWTPDAITNMIETGIQSCVENRVNPGNSATQYLNSDTGRFVVQDDVTGEILQVSRPNFEPNPPL